MVPRPLSPAAAVPALVLVAVLLVPPPAVWAGALAQATSGAAPCCCGDAGACLCSLAPGASCRDEGDACLLGHRPNREDRSPPATVPTLRCAPLAAAHVAPPPHPGGHLVPADPERLPWAPSEPESPPPRG